MPIYHNAKAIHYYPNPEVFWRKIHAPLGVESILDVGAGHGGVLDYGYWTSLANVKKVACDIEWIRPMDPSWKIDLKVDARELSKFYGENSFDVVQCFETLEHIKESDQVIEELVKVAKKAVFITSCDEGHHQGPEQDALEKLNPYQAYVGQPSIETLERLGFTVGVEHFEKRQIVAWKIKI